MNEAKKKLNYRIAEIRSEEEGRKMPQVLIKKI